MGRNGDRVATMQRGGRDSDRDHHAGVDEVPVGGAGRQRRLDPVIPGTLMAALPVG